MRIVLICRLGSQPTLVCLNFTLFFRHKTFHFFLILNYYSAMKTSGERQHVSSSELSDSGDGDIPFENSTDTRPQDITMETDHSENADNKGAI